jgi:flagellar hook-associated protein 2
MTSISGLGSGYDFTSLIDQLIAIERQPYVRIQNTISKQQKAIDAIGLITGKLGTIRTAAEKLNTSAEFFQVTAKSSDDASVVATASSTALSGTISFTVNQVAKAAAKVSGNSVSSLATTVATGNFTINGQTINVGDGSLQSVVNAINSTSNIGVRAAAVRVSANEFRLQIASTTTGAASAANIIDGGNLAALGTFADLEVGQNAQLTVGSGPGAYVVSSASNTITDLMPGVTLTVKKPTTSAVTIDTAVDNAKIGDAIQDLVSQANIAIDEIKLQTKVSTSTTGGSTSTTAGPLTGNFAIRQLATSITNAVITAVGGTTYGSAGLVGVEVTRDGKLSFNRTKFNDKMASDPQSVARMFTSGASTTDPRVSFVAAGGRTTSGTYAVNVTQAASQATTTGMIGVGTVASSNRVSVVSGGVTVDYDTVVGNDLNQVRDGLNAALLAGGITDVTASVAGGGIQLQATGYGVGVGFDAKFDALASFATFTGQDVVGTINGETTTGAGQILSVNNSTSTLNGLSLLVTATTSEILGPTALGSVSYEPGIAQRLIKAVNDALDTTVGSLTSAKASFQANIDTSNKTLERMDYALSLREKTLKSQYAKLDTTLGMLKGQSDWLTGQLKNLSANNGN